MIAFRMMQGSKVKQIEGEPLVLNALAYVFDPGWVIWDITNHVKDAIYNGYGSVNLLILLDANSYSWEKRQVNFHSKEYTDDISLRPKIIVDGVTIGASKDTELLEGEPAKYDSYYLPYIRLTGNTGGHFRIIISFPLTGITSVSTATLNLYMWYRDQYAPYNTMRVFKCTRPNWSDIRACWNAYDVGLNWTTPGGDYTAEGFG